MNIKRAKEEIEHTVKAYLAKDTMGEYAIPSIRQRPILLMGPPGIGKTQIMEQAARECGVALVAYTITHHTRQSAVGLPFIRQRHYGDKDVSVTEYTMSEIISSVYAKMEATGLKEGILFIDEIHRLPRQVEEVLYPALEDYALDIMIGKGPSAQSIRINLPRFTLVGATTRAGQITGPLRDRFGVLLKLELYSPDELSRIIQRSAGILDQPITPEGAYELAKCSRGTPRVANRFLKRVRDFATVLGDGIIDRDVSLMSLKRMDVDALGLDGEHRLDIVLMQLVKLVRDGETVRMSKRTGNAITLTDLLEEVPIDSARFLFNMHDAGSGIDFDLDQAVKTDNDNPVYYVQYAHARICSILKKMESEGVAFAGAEQVDATLLTDPSEMDLIRMLAAFPQEIVMAAEKYDPSRINRFVIDLASAFHRFYGNCRIQGADPAVQQARLALCIGVKNAIFNVLTMFKINVPEKM